MKRIIVNLVIFGSILFLPYWLYIPLILASVVILPFFWEGILFGFLIDVLYEVVPAGQIFILSSHAIGATLLVIVVMIGRERIRFHV